jgi:hypothetical protein
MATVSVKVEINETKVQEYSLKEWTNSFESEFVIQNYNEVYENIALGYIAMGNYSEFVIEQRIVVE